MPNWIILSFKNQNPQTNNTHTKKPQQPNHQKKKTHHKTPPLLAFTVLPNKSIKMSDEQAYSVQNSF